MKQYPETIDLAKYANISDAEIVKDIADIEYEISSLHETMKAERVIAETHPNPNERRMADFKAGARPGQITDARQAIALATGPNHPAVPGAAE